MDIRRKRGDTYPIRFLLKSGTTGQPVPLTDYTDFALAVTSTQYPETGADELFRFAGQVVSGEVGIVEFPVSVPASTSVGSFWYDAEYIDPAGKVRTFVDGRYIVVQDRTK